MTNQDTNKIKAEAIFTRRGAATIGIDGCAANIKYKITFADGDIVEEMADKDGHIMAYHAYGNSLASGIITIDPGNIKVKPEYSENPRIL